ncbi:hypothetical protein BpHYR1_004814 [Brachionus plicatilis]|uniref:Uncharacterized protein n=1 Tax=Brachionus plicatilis TaxID=10195 RepID=A0A3M7S8V6_BRAPC|nr:hypothetical protein BpHYR1_004814 [Brachionus plicatilis]
MPYIPHHFSILPAFTQDQNLSSSTSGSPYILARYQNRYFSSNRTCLRITLIEKKEIFSFIVWSLNHSIAGVIELILVYVQKDNKQKPRLLQMVPNGPTSKYNAHVEPNHQVIEDELNRSKYDKVNTYYYNQSYFQYIWNLAVTIFIFKILWSVLPMAVTWIVNWFEKKPTTQSQYVRQELKITPTKFTTNQDFNVWKKGFERYA